MSRSLKWLFKSLGLSNVGANILSILVSENKSMSLDELAEKSGYVKSHVLYASNILEKMKLIEKSYAKRRLIISVKRGAVTKLLKHYMIRIKDSLNDILEETHEIRSDLKKEIDKVLHEVSTFLERLGGDE